MKTDKAAGVKIGKTITPHEKFSANGKAILDMVTSEVSVLNEMIVKLEDDNAALVIELECSDGRNMDYVRKIDQLLSKNDGLKDDIINITKSFCCIK